MVIAEGLAILGSFFAVIGIKMLAKKWGYKIKKGRLRRMLLKGFELMDIDIIKLVIAALEDFDTKHKTKKLDKYLLNVTKTFRNRDDLPNLNEHIILNRPKDININNILDRKEMKEEMNIRRDEIIERKNMIREKQMKLNKVNNRVAGAMG